jgi:hypothetical protein
VPALFTPEFVSVAVPPTCASFTAWVAAILTGTVPLTFDVRPARVVRREHLEDRAVRAADLHTLRREYAAVRDRRVRLIDRKRTRRRRVGGRPISAVLHLDPLNLLRPEIVGRDDIPDAGR